MLRQKQQALEPADDTVSWSSDVLSGLELARAATSSQARTCIRSRVAFIADRASSIPFSAAVECAGGAYFHRRAGCALLVLDSLRASGAPIILLDIGESSGEGRIHWPSC